MHGERKDTRVEAVICPFQIKHIKDCVDNMLNIFSKESNDSLGKD